MSHKEKRRKKSYHVRFNSSPYIGQSSGLTPIRSAHSLDDSCSDEEQSKSHSTVRPLAAPENMKPLQMFHKRTHMRSASCSLDNIAILARDISNDTADTFVSHDIDEDNKVNTLDFGNLHRSKYSKKEQEELEAIQINFKKWIG
eukprot:31061_1